MITHFPKPEFPKRTLPGLVAFQFAPVGDVSVFPDTIVQQVEDALTFVGGKSWLNGYGTQGTLRLDIKPVIENGVTVYEHVLPGFAPGSDSNMDSLFQEMLMNPKYVVNVKDNRGRWRLIGNKKVGARLQAEFGTGYLGEQRVPGWNFQFIWRHKQPAPFYQSATDLQKYKIELILPAFGHGEAVIEQQVNSYAVGQYLAYSGTNLGTLSLEIKPNGGAYAAASFNFNLANLDTIKATRTITAGAGQLVLHGKEL